MANVPIQQAIDQIFTEIAELREGMIKALPVLKENNLLLKQELEELNWRYDALASQVEELRARVHQMDELSRRHE